MRVNVPLNLYDVGLLVVFGFAGWQLFYCMIRGYEWLQQKPDAWWVGLAFVVWMFGFLIGGILFLLAMLVTAWKPW